MRIQRYITAHEFYRDAERFLAQREAENCLILGRVGALRQEQTKPENVLAIVFDDDSPVACTMMTPPYSLVLTRTSDRAIELLARYAFSERLTVPRVAGPVETARLFAHQYGELTNKTCRDRYAMRIFQLDQVIPPEPVSGSMRCAEEKDIDLLLEWNIAFSEAIGDPGATREGVMQRLQKRQYYLWTVNGLPVSMAAWGGRMPNGVRINSVYTPPDLRGKGYASNCVASLSQHLLDDGCGFCCLFTDLANPTSNKIYQRIGYSPVCDWVDIEFNS